MQAAALLASLCERLDDAVFLVSPQRRVLWLNAAARTLFGIGEGAVGRPFADLVGDYRVVLLVESALDHGVEVADELEDVLGTRTLQARAVPLEEGGTLQVAAVFHDVTRLRHLETVRRDFVANVSHELRTPVTAIHLLVETLQNGALGEPEAAAEFVDRIGSEVAHLRQMVDELLELSLMEAGERPLRMAPVELVDLVEAADRLRPLAEERGVQLRFDVAGDTPPVLGDVSRLELVVRNLVHNAIKFTPRGGAVRVWGRSARTADGVDRVQVNVQDTGIGISRDDLARLASPFEQVESQHSKTQQGTGLGLALSKALIGLHGGALEIQSEPGKGTTVSFTLDIFQDRNEGGASAPHAAE